VAIIIGFTRTIEACKKKLNLLFKLYKTEKLANGISREENYECKLYESIDQCWHQVGIIIKHVKTSANDTYLSQFENNIELLEKKLLSKQHHNLQLKEIRKNFMNKHLACSPTWWKTIMVKNFEKTNLLLERVDHQMD
jgi:dihydroorotase